MIVHSDSETHVFELCRRGSLIKWHQWRIKGTSRNEHWRSTNHICFAHKHTYSWRFSGWFPALLHRYCGIYTGVYCSKTKMLLSSDVVGGNSPVVCGHIKIPIAFTWMPGKSLNKTTVKSIFCCICCHVYCFRQHKGVPNIASGNHWRFWQREPSPWPRPTSARQLLSKL